MARQALARAYFSHGAFLLSRVSFSVRVLFALFCKKRSCTCYVVVVSLRLSVFFFLQGVWELKRFVQVSPSVSPVSPLTRQRQRQCQRQLPCGVRQVPPKGPAGPVVVTR